MKKILLLSIMAMVSLTLFANGSPEKEAELEPTLVTPSYAHEEITISGKLDLDDEYTATVTSGGVTYYLQVPFYVYDLDQVSDGISVTLTGITHEMPVWAKENTQVLMVTGGTFDGEEFTLANRGGRWGDSPMRGTQGNGYRDHPMNGYGSGPSNGYWDHPMDGNQQGMRGHSSRGRR